jgi:hypothetical protein
MPLFMHSLQASPSSSLSGPTEKREAKREKKTKKGKEKKKTYLGQPIRRIHVGHGALQVCHVGIIICRRGPIGQLLILSWRRLCWRKAAAREVFGWQWQYLDRSSCRWIIFSDW